MASLRCCDSCFEENKIMTAIQYCSDCKEHFCEKCTDIHSSRFQGVIPHHIIDMESLKSTPPTQLKHCEVHSDILLEFYCTQHDIICCRRCIADSHPSCHKILPIDVASIDIHSSSLLLDSIHSLTDIRETLETLLKDRENNLKSLKTTKSNLIQQIGNAKLKLIKHLDEMEKKLIGDLNTIQIKSENEINEQNSKISELQVTCQQKKEGLEFLQEHGSNAQLFLYLRHTMKSVDDTEDEVKKLSSSFHEIDIEFKEKEKRKKRLIGSVSEIRRPCKFEYKQKGLHKAQAEVVTTKPLEEFEVKGRVKLMSSEYYIITDIAITCDNNLLLCSYSPSSPKVYMYRDCKEYDKESIFTSPPYGIAVIPETDTAVITLPQEKSIQFLNTTAFKQRDKVNICKVCFGVTATGDKIFLGGKGKVHILDIRGSQINTINVGSEDIHSLHYDEVHANILCRSYGRLVCSKEDGTFLYQYKVSGWRGLTVDGQGNVYVSQRDSAEIHRITFVGNLRDAIKTAKSSDALIFNNDYSKLFVSMTDSIIIYKCKW